VTRVTRRYRFAASHRLHSRELSERGNRELYGKCNNPYGHGHDYVLEVSVAGPLDTRSGQVVNVQVLDRLVNEQILQDFDHRYFNADVREFSGDLVPTSENILRVIENRLSAHWHRSFPEDWPRLEGIRLQETKRNRFELRTN
jgi:6-pyruvoyltetrahydropterin/6-carboxytetrahydropterin synthase